MKKLLLASIFIVLLSVAMAQQKGPAITILTVGSKTSLRGLSVVNNNVIWVSGSNGTVGLSINAGGEWKWMTVSGLEKADFRDIEAFDEKTAVIMAVGEPAHILKTTDGGKNWKVVYENRAKGMFLDAMEFSSERQGMVIGDPLDGRFFIAATNDGGDSWRELPASRRPAADVGEAFFAASGTNIRAWNRTEFVYASGGKTSNLIAGAEKKPIPMMHGESSGTNSIAIHQCLFRNKIVAVGGDYAADTITFANCFFSTNNGKSWIKPQISPHGYRSCVEFISRKKLITCGTKGVDFSSNGGKSWTLISAEGFHVCRKAKDGNAVFLAGNNGKIGRLTLE